MLAFVVLVETLDKCFSNVCELDIVFNYGKVLVSRRIRVSTTAWCCINALVVVIWFTIVADAHSFR